MVDTSLLHRALYFSEDLRSDYSATRGVATVLAAVMGAHRAPHLSMYDRAGWDFWILNWSATSGILRMFCLQLAIRAVHDARLELVARVQLRYT